ncbi:MAG: shikimate kinase [Saprospirales bacterium]|nr:shikimate kinase [Saprospirales bacterium]
MVPILEIDYVDLDKLIEEKEQLTVKEIFEQKGENYFREKEKEFIEQLEPTENLIVSTGGGAPCFFNNMQLMNEKGLTIYLNRNKEKTIWRLLKGQYKRPLIANLSAEELEKFYDEKLSSRKQYYEQAKLHVGDADVEEIAEMIRTYKN